MDEQSACAIVAGVACLMTVLALASGETSHGFQVGSAIIAPDAQIRLSWDWADLNSTIAATNTTLCLNASEALANCTLYFDGIERVHSNPGLRLCYGISSIGEGNYTASAICANAAGNEAASGDAWLNVAAGDLEALPAAAGSLPAIGREVQSPTITAITVTGSAVTGSAVTGSAVTGSAVTGSAVTGSAVTGSDFSDNPAAVDAMLLAIGAAAVIGCIFLVKRKVKKKPKPPKAR